MKLEKKKILVFRGGTGIIGNHLVERFLKDGAMVTVYDSLNTGRTTNLGNEWGWKPPRSSAKAIFEAASRLALKKVRH
jgi:hypothetical protein